jgi:DNA-directed RNA polymerase specialized sigma24 family protein
VTGSANPDRKNDRRLAYNLRTGQVNALTEVFDAYGAPLYDYCHSLLCDQSTAAGVVCDSLIAAQEHVAVLREPERLRGWLYAIARKECTRRLDQPDREVAGREEPVFHVADENAADQQLAISALSGLSVRQREVVELAIRHHLNVPELAGVLELPLPQATDLLTRSLGDLDTAFAAATIATSGSSDCPSLAALTDEQSRPLTSEVIRRLTRHVESCPACGEHRQRELPITQLLRSLPSALIPDRLRRDLLALASDQDKHEERATLAQRAEPFDIWGWPTGHPEGPGQTRNGSWSRAPRLWTTVAAAVVVALIVGAVLLLAPGSRSKPGQRDRPPIAAGLPDPTPSSTPSVSPQPTPARTSPRPLPPPARILSKPSRKAKPIHKPVPPPGKAAFSTSCDGTSDSCAAALDASRGTVHWSARPSQYISVGESRGTLSDGETVIISISADTQAACMADEPVTTGTVSFSPGGPAFLSWSC